VTAAAFTTNPASRTRRRFASRVAAMALVAVLAVVAWPVAGQSSGAAASPPALSGAALLAALRKGGYILYFRHTSTDFGQNDDRMTGFEDCATQRNLTDAGRDEARAIGAAIRALGIPIGEVLASPFCRTRETAMLIFGKATPSAAVRGGPAQADDDRYAELKLLLSRPVPGGANLAIASHGNPYRAVVGGAYLAEGEAAVVLPRGKDGFRIVARIRKDDWAALATTDPKPAGG
jgi:phosphohistidine phosphatase SixA